MSASDMLGSLPTLSLMFTTVVQSRDGHTYSKVVKLAERSLVIAQDSTSTKCLKGETK